MWYYQLEKGVPIFYTGTQFCYREFQKGLI